jgi:cholesterol oxidase
MQDLQTGDAPTSATPPPTDTPIPTPPPVLSLEFTEEMKGHLAAGQSNFADGETTGKARADGYFMFHLTIRTEDLNAFLDSPAHEANAVGWVEGDLIGGRRDVERGRFQLFITTDDLRRRKMVYHLFFHDASGRPLTLTGFKNVQDEPGIPGLNVWEATTTLYTNLLAGDVQPGEEATAQIVATGILHILLPDFAHQMTTMRVEGGDVADRLAGLARFGGYFAGSLWEVYGPSLAPGIVPYRREIPLYTTQGIQGATCTTYPFTTADKLGLCLQRFQRAPCDDVILIVHGLTTSTDMFIMPEHVNLVQTLLDQGFTDVWSLDFRMSNRHSYNLSRNRFNMDDVALYDHPAAIERLRAEIGSERRIHVICHCLGSVSFMMSLFGKAVTGIASVISNSVALTPRVPTWSLIKLMFSPFASEYLLSLEYVNPSWRHEPGPSIGKTLAWCVSQFHKECNVPECHMLSFMWGAGYPALYLHDNLHEVTHRRGGDLYGGVSVNYYRHVRRMVFHNNTAVKYLPGDPRYASLPDDYFQYAKEIETPVLLMTGEQNHVFADSNIVCHQRLEQICPGRHRLQVFPNYGHQDVFMGKNVHRDIFPTLLAFLKEHSK